MRKATAYSQYTVALQHLSPTGDRSRGAQPLPVFIIRSTPAFVKRKAGIDTQFNKVWRIGSMFGKMMNNFYYGKSGKGDFRKEDLPKNRWQLFWEMLRCASPPCAV